MIALVTGGTGFVGSHIVRALNEAGHSARVLHRTTSKLDALEGLAYESALGDILDAESLRSACAGCDWVFHVAAVADYWRADHSRMMEANVEGTRHVLAAAREAGVKRLVFTSSGAAVGHRDDDQPADENVPFNLPPEQFPYGYSKWLAEEVCHEAVRMGQDVVIVNPAVILGPGDLNLISGSIVLEIRRRQWTTPITSGGVTVIDVRDVAKAHLAAAERGRAGERYLLGNENVSHRELMTTTADVVGVPRPFFVVPNWLVPIVATLVSIARKLHIPTPIDSNQVRLGAQNIFFDCHKAWDELGQPQIPLRQSLQDTYEWYKANGYL
ncbi:MAG: SDR family oxidoreductase [Burkholderiales bacterium]|nr:SDR family oxidoreductase [Anaerolineae bacterium]